jgi:hypothetical protein
MLAEAKALNRTELAKSFGRPSSAIVNSIDALHILASEHVWTFDGWLAGTPNTAHDVLFACFHKTLLSLHTSHELTLDGLYGLARPHLRHAFESLMIAKYCSCDPDSDVFDRWIDGMDFYFTNGVLKKLSAPGIGQFDEVWSLLCKWSHATIFANQMSTDLESTGEQTGVNLAVIGALLECTHHLLNSHILTPTIKYHGERFDDDLMIAQARMRLNLNFTVLREIRGSVSRKLVKEYRSTWRLK